MFVSGHNELGKVDSVQHSNYGAQRYCIANMYALSSERMRVDPYEIKKEERLKKAIERKHLIEEKVTIISNEASADIKSTDNAIAAVACSKFATIAERHPRLVPESVIPDIVNNLVNNKKAPKHFMIELHFFEEPRFNSDPLTISAHSFAKKALVCLGERAMPYLKQAFVKGNGQLREKIVEVLHEIALNDPKLITEEFMPLLCEYASHGNLKARHILEHLESKDVFAPESEHFNLSNGVLFLNFDKDFSISRLEVVSGQSGTVVCGVWSEKNSENKRLFTPNEAYGGEMYHVKCDGKLVFAFEVEDNQP